MSMYSLGNDLYSGKRSFDLIGRRKIWFAIAAILIVGSIALFAFKQPNLGIEFRGGSQFTVTGTTNQSLDPAYKVLAETGTDSAPRISNVGSDSIRIQTVELTDAETQQVRADLADAYSVPPEDVTSTFIGPSWGQDVLNKAIRAMVIFMVLVSVVLMIYFRSWTIAVGALGALLHDFIVTLGIYWLVGFEVTPSTVIGLLTIMGYSLYDTVVVFDKVRENTSRLQEQYEYTYEEQANLAVNQTLIRSINTSVTGLLPVAAVLFIGVGLLGADTLRDLALVMFVGMILSTISSIFLAAPLAVSLGMRNQDIKDHTEEVLARRAERAEDEISSDSESNSGRLSPVNAEQHQHHVGGHQGHSAQPKRTKKRNRR